MVIARASFKHVKVFVCAAVMVAAVAPRGCPEARRARRLPDPNNVGSAVTLSSIKLNGASATRIAVTRGSR